MAQGMDPQSILARSQAQTEASLRNVKKLNRRANLFAGLSAYDTFRRQQAIDRANNFYGVQSRRIENVQNMFRDSINHWNTHIEKYGEGDWENSWWLQEADQWIANTNNDEATIGADDMIGGVPARQYFADFLQQNDIDRAARFESYKNLHEAYSDPSLTGLLNLSEESQAQYIADYTAAEERDLTRITAQIGRQGGLLSDVRRVLGLGPELEDVAYTTRNSIKLPEGLSERTTNLIDNILSKTEMRQSINTLTGEYNETLGRGYLERIGLSPNLVRAGTGLRIPVEQSNDQRIRDFTNSLQLEQGRLFRSSAYPGLEAFGVDGLTVDESIKLHQVDPDTGMLVPSELSSSDIFVMADDEQKRQMTENLNGNLNNLRDVLINAESLASDFDQGELKQELTAYINNPILLAELASSILPFQQLYGVSMEGGTFQLRSSVEDEIGNYNLILNRIGAITSNDSLYNMGQGIEGLPANFTVRPGSILNNETARFLLSAVMGQDVTEEEPSTGEGRSLDEAQDNFSVEELQSRIERGRTLSSELPTIYNLSRDEISLLQENPEVSFELERELKAQVEDEILTRLNNSNLLIGDERSIRQVLTQIASDSSIFNLYPIGKGRGEDIMERRKGPRSNVINILEDMINKDLSTNSRTFTSLERLNDDGYEEAMRSLLETIRGSY